MKNMILLIFLFSFLFFSCGENREVREQLDVIDGLVEANPDSAFALLERVEFPDRLNDRQFARYSMLYCRTADKLYKDMLYTEQLIRALHWYQKHGTSEEVAWMGLYLGRSFAEDKFFIPAMEAYMKALDLAKEKQLYNVAGYICSYMGDLYFYTGQDSEERLKLEEATTFFQKAENIRSYAFALRDVARIYARQDSLFLAFSFALKADSIISEMKDVKGLVSVKNCLGNIYERLGEYEKAKQCYELSLSYGTKVGWNNASTYLALGILYYQIDSLELARSYLKKIDSLDKIDNQYVPSDRLYVGSLIEEEAGNTVLALKYLRQCYEAKDSLYDTQKQVDIVDAEKRHKVVTLHRENRRLRNSRHRLLAILVIACFSFVLIYQNQQRKKLKKINDQQLLLEERERQLILLNQKIKEKDVEQENLVQLKKEKEQIQIDLIELRNEKFQMSTLVRKLKKQSRVVDVEKKNTLKKNEELNLIILIQTVYPHVAVFMENNKYHLTEAEKQICYLSFLQLGLNEEAVLLDISPESVNKRRHRARQKLNLINKNVGLYDFLLTVEN